MKKHFIAISMIIACQGLYAISSQDMITELQTQVNKYKEALDPNISMPGQVRNQRLNNWKNSFNKAKIFVQDNSKAMGVKDSDLTNGMVALDKAYMNLMDIVPKISTVTTGIQLDQMKQALARIFQNINQAINNLNKVKFSLSHKIQAQNVILAIGKILKELIATSNTIINAQKQSIAPALPPRNSQTKPAAPSTSPSTPPARPLPATPTTTTSKFVLTPQMKNFLEKEINNPTEAHLDYIRRLLVAHKGHEIGSSNIMQQNEARLQQVFEEILNKFKNTFLSEIQKFAAGKITAFDKRYTIQDVGYPIANTLVEIVRNKLQLKDTQDLMLVDQTVQTAIVNILTPILK